MKKLVGSMCMIALLAGCKSGDDDSGGAAGMGGSGGSGGGPVLTGMCMGVDVSAGGPALHAAAAGALTVMSPCGFSSCHMGTGKAKLVLLGATDLKTLLVGKPSCEAPAVPLVDGSGNETALNNSWLWQKLTAMVDSSMTGVIVAQPAWGMSAACGQLGDQPFGARMPMSNSDTMASADKLTAVKAWICAGAPGPM